MLLNTDHARLNLDRDGFAHFADACGTHVHCLDGVAWVTVDGDPRDIVLTHGQSHVVDSRAEVIVCAIQGPATIEFHADSAGAPCDRPRTARYAGVWRALVERFMPPAPVAA